MLHFSHDSRNHRGTIHDCNIKVHDSRARSPFGALTKKASQCNERGSKVGPKEAKGVHLGPRGPMCALAPKIGSKSMCFIGVILENSHSVWEW